MANEPKRLEHLIEKAQKDLGALERKRLFTSDESERDRLEREIEHLQRDLFQHRKVLAALSDEANTVGAPEPPRSTRPLIFISYSHADEEWLQRLRLHLKPLERTGALDIWDDRRIEAGSRWREQIEAALKTAKAAVLLVSADYLASTYIAERELPFLLEVAHDRGMPVLPIIVSPCRFTRTPLNEFQAVNSPTSPMTGKSKQEQEQILAKVAEVIRKTLGVRQSPLLSSRG
ncbi:MAG: toll/interleukin-1 receptor domain-containing protein [Gammaproteobacteria bacterium]